MIQAYAAEFFDSAVVADRLLTYTAELLDAADARAAGADDAGAV
jgi:hypothetical protein